MDDRPIRRNKAIGLYLGFAISRSVLSTFDSKILLNSPKDLSSDPTRFAGQGPVPCDCS